MPGLALLVSSAVRNGGFVSRTQILEHGLSDGFIAHSVRRGDLEPVVAGVYRMLPLEGEVPILKGAVLALPQATVSHSSAARIHNLPYLRRGEPTVTVHHRTTHTFPGVTVRRSLDLAEHHTVVIDGLSITTIDRTLVDLAADLHPRHLERVVDGVLTTEPERYESLSALLLEVGRRGRPGTRALRDVLAIRGEGTMVGATKLEQLGRRVLRLHGVEEPVPQYPIPWDPRRRFDDAFPDASFALEWHSRRWHSSFAHMRADRERDRECAVHAWLLMRITWHDLKQRPGEIARQVATVLEQRRER